VGEQKVYDLTVQSTSCFIANDIVVHNTWLAVIMAKYAAAVKGERVLIVSPEMNAVEMAERVVSEHGHLPYGQMVAGTLSTFPDGGAERKLADVVRELQEQDLKLYVLDDEDRLSPQYIEQAIEAVKPTLVMVDSVYMLRAAEGKLKQQKSNGRGGRYDRILETVDWLRSASRRYQIPVVAISQLSRDAKMGRGQAEQIKKGHGTGGIEDAIAMTDTILMDCHNVFAIFQDADMRVDKQLMLLPLKVRRRAMITNVVLRWDMEAMLFDEIGTKVTGGSRDDAYHDADYESLY
jgi:replicative DNA helicase